MCYHCAKQAFMSCLLASIRSSFEEAHLAECVLIEHDFLIGHAEELPSACLLFLLPLLHLLNEESILCRILFDLDITRVHRSN